MSDAPEGSPTHLRTAWHPVFVFLLEQLLPADRWRVVSEWQLTREPRRIDAVIIRRGERADPWDPPYLRSVLADLRAHNIVHFKGASDALEPEDLLVAHSYALQYMAAESLRDPGELTLRVVAPALTPRFRDIAARFGCALVETALGVYEGTLGALPMRVVETSVAWPSSHEHLLVTVSPEIVRDPARSRAFDDAEWNLYYHLVQRIARLTDDPKWMAIMKDAPAVRTITREAMREIFTLFTPEERLAGLPPEARLAGLPAAQAVLALPDEILRVLPASYIATLPEDVQAVVRARLARPSR